MEDGVNALMELCIQYANVQLLNVHFGVQVHHGYVQVH